MLIKEWPNLGDGKSIPVGATDVMHDDGRDTNLR